MNPLGSQTFPCQPSVDIGSRIFAAHHAKSSTWGIATEFVIDWCRACRLRVNLVVLAAC